MYCKGPLQKQGGRGACIEVLDSLSGTELIARRGYSDTGAILEGAKGILESGLQFYGEKKEAEGKASGLEAAIASGTKPGAGMPGWVLPVVIGGGLLVGAMFLLRK